MGYKDVAKAADVIARYSQSPEKWKPTACNKSNALLKHPDSPLLRSSIFKGQKLSIVWVFCIICDCEQMGRTKEIARRSTLDGAPLKRHCTAPPRGRKSVERPLLDNPSTNSEISQDEEATALVLPNLDKFSNTDLRAGLSLLYASIGSCSTALVDRYDATVREVVTKEYNQALEERDSALNKLDNMGAELMEVQNSLSKAQAEFESGKKAWEAEKKALTEILDKEFNIFGTELNKVLENFSKSRAELEQTSKEQDILELGKKVLEAERMEMAEKIEMANKEKENAYCKGYLDGWFKKPHAYVLAWHEAKLADEVTDHCVLQMMRKLPKSLV